MKFIADMNYSVFASVGCLLTEIADQLHELSGKINIVDCLSRHFAEGTPKALASCVVDIRNLFKHVITGKKFYRSYPAFTTAPQGKRASRFACSDVPERKKTIYLTRGSMTFQLKYGMI